MGWYSIRPINQDVVRHSTATLELDSRKSLLCFAPESRPSIRIPPGTFESYITNLAVLLGPDEQRVPTWREVLETERPAGGYSRLGKPQQIAIRLRINRNKQNDNA
jgi:hypothetical protein